MSHMLISVCPQVRLSSYPHLLLFLSRHLPPSILASFFRPLIPFPLCSNSSSLHLLLQHLPFPTFLSSGCIAIFHNYSKNHYSCFESVPRRDHVSPPPCSHDTQYTREMALVCVWSLGAKLFCQRVPGLYIYCYNYFFS